MASSGHNAFENLRAGRPAECERFVRNHYVELYRWFLWLTHCPERAADLTQESFASFWDSLRRATPHVSPRTWLFSVSRNVWRKDCRNRRLHGRNGDDELDLVPSPDASPVAAAEYKEFARALEAEVAKLPVNLREVLTLRLWQEFDYEQIAAVQGINRDLARWRFFRARQLIRERLKAWDLQEEYHGK